jgi:hypothetical protein
MAAAAAAAGARRLLSRRASTSSISTLLRRGGPAAAAAPHEPLLRPAALAAVASRLGFLRGMARRPGGDGYSPMRSGGGGGGGDRAPTEMAPLFPGCDYEHWLIVMDKPGGEGATKQQMIDCYIQTLSKVLGRCASARLRRSPLISLAAHNNTCTRMIFVRHGTLALLLTPSSVCLNP